MHIEIDYSRMSPPGSSVDIVTLHENLVVDGEFIPLYENGYEDRFEIETTRHIWGDL